MFDLTLNGIGFSAFFFFAVMLESGQLLATFSHKYADCTSLVARYLLVTLLAFPWIFFARVRAAVKGLHQAGAKLLSFAGLFSARPYLSEIALSVFVWAVLLGSFAARRFIRRFVRRAGTNTAPLAETKSPS